MTTHRSIALLVAVTLPLAGQVSATSGSLVGQVKDASGAVIAGVRISARNLATGFSRAGVTSESGSYSLVQLAVGAYEVTASHAGFKTSVTHRVELEVNQRARLDVVLEVGQLAERVEVRGSAPLLDTETSAAGEVIDGKKVVELPLNGRNFLQLALLVPGTSEARGSTQAQRTGVAVSVNGLRPSHNTYTVDGIDANDSINNFFTVRPNVDAIEEFKVMTNLYDVEFGRTAGAQINIVTKSGSNQLHGSLFDFLRNDVLDARNFFNTAGAKDPLARNQFGGVLGFPIRRDKTFGFGDYQGLRERRGVFRRGRVPSGVEREGNLATINAAATDPLNGGQRFPGAAIPASRLDTVARQALSHVPLPNAAPRGGLNFERLSSTRVDQNQFSGRIDHRFSEKDSIFGRFYYSNLDDLAEGFFNTPAIGGANANTGSGQGEHVRNTGVSHTHIFSPGTLNELRLGHNWKRYTRQAVTTGDDWAQALGLTGPATNPERRRFPQFNPTGWTPYGAGTGYVNRVAENFQISDTLSVVRGNHILKFGMDGRRTRQDVFSASTLHGSYSFNGRYSGDGMSDFLLGYPSSANLTRQNDATRSRSRWIAGFAQDDWTVHPKLTLNLGLRWDFFEPLKEIRNRMSVFRPAAGLLVPVGAGDVPRAGFSGDTNNFGPRVGFAYRASTRWVIRGGYGIFFSNETLNAMDTQGRNPPWVSNLVATGDPRSPTLRTATALAGATEGLFPSLSSIDGATWRDAYTQHFNFLPQVRIRPDLMVEFGYVRTKATGLPAVLNVNQPLPGPGAIQGRRPFPREFANINMYSPVTGSVYNGLQVKVEKRLSGGLSVLTSYTLSKALTDTDEFNDGFEDVRNRRIDRGPYQFNALHNFTTSYSYAIPSGAGWAKPLRVVLGGWQTLGILTLHTGFPVTPRVAGDPANTGTSTRPDRIGDGRLPNPVIDRWFDVAAFAVPRPFTFGTAGPGILTGPGLRNLDFSVLKSFAVREGHRIEFRAEFFNVSNTPKFDAPQANISVAATAGRINGAYGQRESQMALKYVF